MNKKTKIIIWSILLVLTAIFGVATVMLAGMPDEVVLNDGSVGYSKNSKELLCHVMFAAFFWAWLILGVRIKKERSSNKMIGKGNSLHEE